MADKDLRERNRRKLPALKPVDGRRVNSYGLFRTDVWTILEVGVLAFLLRFQVKTRQTTEIFLHYSLVDSSTAPNTLAIIMGHPVQMISLITTTRSEQR
jgi:hypothetical protein